MSEDRLGRERAKVATVQRRRFVPVEEKDFAGKEDEAAAPDGQRSTGVILFARFRHCDPIDAHGKSVAADFLSGQSSDALDEGRAFWKMAAFGKPVGERFRGPSDDKVSDRQIDDWLHGIEPDRHTG